MSCPHSTSPSASPDTCSLCRGADPTQRIVTTEDGVLMVNGVGVGTLRDRNTRRMKEEVATLSPAARAKLEREDQEADE